MEVLFRLVAGGATITTATEILYFENVTTPEECQAILNSDKATKKDISGDETIKPMYLIEAGN